MNKHDTRPSSSSGAMVIVIVLLVVMLFGGLAVVGGALLFYVRVGHQREAVVMMEQRAIAEMERAQAEAEGTRVEAELQRIGLQEQQKSLAMQSAGKTQMVLIIDRDGTATLDGAEWTDELLQLLITDADPIPGVLLRVDPRCQFAAVIAVQTQLREAGVTEMQLATIESGDEKATE